MSCPFCLPTGERSNRCLHPLTVEEYLNPKNALHRSTERLHGLQRAIKRLNEDREVWCQQDRDLYKRLLLDYRKESKQRLDLVRSVLCGHRPRAS